MRGGKPSELQHSHSAAVVILLVGSQNPVALRLVGRIGERVTPPSRLWCTSDMGGYSYRGQAWSGVRMCSQ
jgi:hypothetical protein